VREAARSAIDNAPPTAYFSVIQFNETSTIIEDFTNDHNRVKNAIDIVESVPNNGTCLYDAVYDAIDLLDDQIQNPQEGWRGDVGRAGGGSLLDMGYHIIDQLLWWFGEPEKIFVATSNLAVPNIRGYAEDTSTVSFKYKTGLQGTIVLSRSSGEKKEEYSLVGSKFQITGNKKFLLLQDKTGKVVSELHDESGDLVAEMSWDVD